MKKILLGLILSFSFIAAQQIGEYSLDCESEQSSNYTVYFNGFPYMANNSLSLTGNVKQGQNKITLIATEDITNVHLEFTDDITDKVVSNWNIALTNGVARTLVVNGLDNRGFNNEWESADSLTSLSASDKTSISNIANKWVDILENEKFGAEYGAFCSNESKYLTRIDMVWQGSTSEEAINGNRYIFTNTYGARRSSFAKNVDYEIKISPYNNKIVTITSKSRYYLVYIGNKNSTPDFNWDYKVKYFTFFKKDGQWWDY